MANTKFITFYSYKGGVGRTSSLVNTAILRANEGNTVVVIDFDLEAPGTGSYFNQLDPKYDGNRPGILEYLVAAIEQKEIPSIKSFAYDLSDKINQANGGKLWVISAGQTGNQSYYKNLEKIKWTEIFENSNGELLLKNLKNQIQTEFGNPDYTFLDSRTGITETGGVCTKYLADLVVIITSLNEQNISGTANIFRELKQERIKMLLVASNIPVGFPIDSSQLFGQRLQNFQESFGKEPDVCIYYYPSLSLNELLPSVTLKGAHYSVLFKSIVETDPLMRSYEELSKKIESSAHTVYSPSYLSIIKNVSNKVLYAPDSSTQSYLQILNSEYSTRFFGSLLIKLKNWSDQWNPQEFSPAKCLDFKDLAESIQTTSNRHLKSAMNQVKQKIWSSIRATIHEAKIDMRKEWEVFADKSDLDSQSLTQVAIGQYNWATDYLIRSFTSVDKNDHFDVAFHAFNIATCLDRTGSADAFVFYSLFSDAIDEVIQNRNSPGNLANYFFCKGIALTKTGKAIEAQRWFNAAVEQGKLSKEDLFSPVSYTFVPFDIFASHVSKYEIRKTNEILANAKEPVLLSEEN